MKYSIVIFLLFLPTLLSCTSRTFEKTLLFIGSYTDGTSDTGIYVYDFDSNTGKVNILHTVNNIVNPSFLTLSPNGDYLYSVNENESENKGNVTAFSVNSITGQLGFLGRQNTGGRNPVHLSVSDDGNYVVNSNYTDPSISVFKAKANGSLGPYEEVIRFKDSSIIKDRQDKAHIHSTNFSPDGNYIFAQDLGADKIRVFQFKTDTDTLLQSRDDLTIYTKPGAGPRHFTFHPNGKFGYGIAELSGMISLYDYKDGKLSFLEEYLSYSKKQEMYRAADIHISPDGKFLYASNRGPEEDSISIFSIDQTNGKLSFVVHKPTYGKHPRNFAIDPSGNFLLVANQFSDTVVIFKRNQETGLLTKLDIEIKIKSPSSVRFYSYK